MKKIQACTLAFSALLLGGCTAQTQQADYIGIDAAKTAALNAAGISANLANFTTAGLDRDNGIDYYEVDFTVNGQEYEFSIDAMTGAVIESKTPSVPSSSGADSPVPSGSLVTDADTFSSSTPQPQNPTIPADPSVVIQPAPAQPSTTTSGITEARAKEIALTHAGLTTDQVSFVKSHIDWDDGRQRYDVEFYTKDYKEYDYEIDAITGDILSWDHDAEHYAAPAPSSNSSSGSGNGSQISADRAKEIALGQVPGATVNDIYEFQVDYDDGRLQYEGKIYHSNMEYEFEIDGYSGAIRNWDVESIYS